MRAGAAAVGSGPSVLDETIIPADFATAGQITDDELHAQLIAPLPAGQGAAGRAADFGRLPGPRKRRSIATGRDRRFPVRQVGCGSFACRVEPWPLRGTGVFEHGIVPPLQTGCQACSVLLQRSIVAVWR